MLKKRLKWIVPVWFCPNATENVINCMFVWIVQVWFLHKCNTTNLMESAVAATMLCHLLLQTRRQFCRNSQPDSDRTASCIYKWTLQTGWNATRCFGVWQPYSNSSWSLLELNHFGTVFNSSDHYFTLFAQVNDSSITYIKMLMHSQNTSVMQPK